MTAIMVGAGGAPRFRPIRRRYFAAPSTARRVVKVAAMGGKGTTRIHRLIEEEGIVLMPGCYDALTAAIVEKSGFSAGFISGYALSASLLGKPDIGLLTSVPVLDFLPFYFILLFELVLAYFWILDRRRWLRLRGMCAGRPRAFPSLLTPVSIFLLHIKVFL